MDNHKLNKLMYIGVRFLYVLTVLLVITGLVITIAPGSALGAMRSNPDDIIPIGDGGGGGGGGGQPEPYVPPADGFTWAIEKRFGPDTNGDGMIDFHWDAVQMKYFDNYIYPDDWYVTFNGCQTEYDYYHPTATQNLYTWFLDDVFLSSSCSFIQAFDDTDLYTVTLIVTDADEVPIAIHDGLNTVEYPVQIKDYFIVAIGDSYGSGQGNPDIPLVAEPGFLGIGWNQIEPPYWQDQRCNRSAYAASSLAALELEASDPHSSVTYISFACSGASINTPRYDEDNPNKNAGVGVLDSYRGEDTNVPYSNSYTNYIPSQMNQLRDALLPHGDHPQRTIDALIVSGGGNDIFFGPATTKCVENLDCWNNPLVSLKEYPGGPSWSLYNILDRAFGFWTQGGPVYTLPHNYDLLGAAIDELSPRPLNVYVMQYFDPTFGNNGDHDRMVDDVAEPNPWYQITIPESAVASHYLVKNLNDTILAAVNRFKTTYTMINWQFVDGIAEYNVDDQVPAGTAGLFVGPPGGPGHGYNADDNWITRADESEIIQGPVNWRNKTKGTMHPNYSGQQAMKSRILRYMIPDIVPTPPQDPPAFTFSYTSNGLTSQATGNGFFGRSCDSTGTCFPKVVAQVVATSDVPMTGAAVLVNDVMGCTGAVHCVTTASNGDTQITYDIEISASGIYRLQFNAQNPGSQVAFVQRQIKVDLEDPILDTPIGPFAVDEGGTVVVSASVATNAFGIPLNNDVLVNYDWDLDNDGIFETTDEQPSFSAAALDGPTSQTIQVRVTDIASRTTTAQATVNIANVAPTVIITDVPLTSDEGTPINLTSEVNDPYVDEALTYAWEVKLNGSSIATGTEPGFSFTTADEGMYEVSLTVSDDDGGMGTAELQTIEVVNVAPSLSNLQVPAGGADEATSFTLSGDISEPGTLDTLTLTIDWGDGSTAESIPLAAGSTSFSADHTYADDDPSGTASDTYEISLSIADDDSGTSSSSTSVVVNNLPPTVSITAPENGNLSAVNTTINLSASLADASALDTLACSVDWADGTSASGALTNGVCTASHAYSGAGVYMIQVTGTDDDLGETKASVMAVVYDPTAGFVTGGGWINSPAGAYKPDVNLSGKATFGFVSKYQKGADVPTGTTAFKFDIARLAFSSDSYEWLVVNQNGTNAQFKGAGKINGALDPNGNAYKFMVWAADGAPDTFRIRIWYDDAGSEIDVYDNGVSQAIGGGSIVVHTGK